MKVHQFFDKDLAQLSYAIVSDGEMVVIDPARDPRMYYEFAEQEQAKIVAVIETHPHADFVSSHAEMGRGGAVVYASKLTEAIYPHVTFDGGDHFALGKVNLLAINTPGHSPDSICVVLQNEEGTTEAVFTGDTLLIGDVGRPDLRVASGNAKSSKTQLARELYYSLRNKLLVLPDPTKVYPAHGPGSLCGKSMSAELESTIGQQKSDNYALQQMDEAHFVNLLLESHIITPKYFPFNVNLNTQGAEDFYQSIIQIPKVDSVNQIASQSRVIDTQPPFSFKTSAFESAWNIPAEGKFETWLGSLVAPGEKYYLLAPTATQLEEVVKRAAKIGYEVNISGTLIQYPSVNAAAYSFDLKAFSKNLSGYTIVDVREKGESQDTPIFAHAHNIPLAELPERVTEIPINKPIVVHCAGGYRSAIGYSILKAHFKNLAMVYDLGESVKEFYVVNS